MTRGSNPRPTRISVSRVKMPIWGDIRSFLPSRSTLALRDLLQVSWRQGVLVKTFPFISASQDAGWQEAAKAWPGQALQEWVQRHWRMAQMCFQQSILARTSNEEIVRNL